MSLQSIVREECLQGATYNISSAGETYFLTINHTIDSDGKILPFEIFINTKNPTLFPWITAITKLASLSLKSGIEPNVVFKELIDVFDPKGGYFIPRTGEFANSLVAHIGLVLSDHVNGTNKVIIEKPVLVENSQ